MELETQLERLCEDLEENFELADPKEVRRRLERLLESLLQFESGMFQGCVTDEGFRRHAAEMLVPLANKGFDRLRSIDPQGVRPWLGALPSFYQPKAVDLGAWRAVLDLPSSRGGFLEQERMRIRREIGQLLEQTRRTVSPGASLIDEIEEAFGALLPTTLRQEWEAAAMGGNPGARGFYVPQRGLEDVLETSHFITSEAREWALIDKKFGDFRLLPFAESEQDWFALDLAIPAGERDYMVVECQHDVGEFGQVYESSEQWLKRNPLRSA